LPTVAPQRGGRPFSLTGERPNPTLAVAIPARDPPCAPPDTRKPVSGRASASIKSLNASGESPSQQAEVALPQMRVSRRPQSGHVRRRHQDSHVRVPNVRQQVGREGARTGGSHLATSPLLRSCSRGCMHRELPRTLCQSPRGWSDRSLPLLDQFTRTRRWASRIWSSRSATRF
jgi:hypothetical protein